MVFAEPAGGGSWGLETLWITFVCLAGVLLGTALSGVVVIIWVLKKALLMWKEIRNQKSENSDI